MRSALAEVYVALPHLVAIDRLPSAVTADGVTVELTDERTATDVVGTLRAHVRAARRRHGRRTGPAHYEVVRTHADRCAITLVLDGIDMATAYHLALAARRAVLDAARHTAAATAAVADAATRPDALPA